MAAGYSPRNASGKPSGTTTPFHHPPRPLPERSRTAPMAVPNVHHSAPPPLPPPRFIDNGNHDLGWHMGNAGEAGSFGDMAGKSASVKPGSSLLGGGQHPRPGKSFPGPERNIDFARKESPRSAPAPSLLAALKAQDSQSQAQHEHHHHNHQRPRSESNPRLPNLRFLDYSTYKLQSEKQMSREALERSSQAYDKQLLSRIGGLNQGASVSSEGSPTSPGGSQNALNRLNGQLLSLSMLKSRDGSTPPPSAGFSPGIPGMRSPLSDSAALDHAPSLPSFPRQQHNLPHYHLHRTSSATSPSRRESSDNPFTVFGTPANRLELRDLSSSALANLRLSNSAMQGLNSQERRSSPADSDDPQNSKTGQKRRAQSPPSDSVIDPRLPASANDTWQRSANSPLQLSSSRGTQAARFNQSQSQGASSLSTTASSGPRNSYTSSYGLSNPSTAATSYSSDRISPSLYPSAADSRSQSLLSAYQPAQSNQLNAGGAQGQSQLQQSPQQASPPIGTPTYIHRKNNSGILRAPGLWICDCCPKKPKKFESEEELRIHEMEKQYICQYCHNRFKNKNEAERHQNSLHLRRHSWSCSALTTIEAAFHPTPINNLSVQFNRLNKDGAGNEDPTTTSYQGLHQTATDTCGYCGQEFINPPNWDERVEHLNHVHKFGECNQSKKFFRADHFRQHLKHSHAGTSGKWTNMLENACMKDEPPPQPIAPGIMPGVPNAMPGGVPGIAMVGQQALLAQHQLQQQQAQQAQQAAQQQHDQQQTAAPQATMASILSSALGQHASQQDQSPYGNSQSGYTGGEQSNPYSQAQTQAQQAQQHYQQGQKSESTP